MQIVEQETKELRPLRVGFSLNKAEDALIEEAMWRARSRNKAEYMRNAVLKEARHQIASTPELDTNPAA
jgi:hypothetical protein